MLRKGRQVTGVGLPPRHANDYSTHIPVLVGLASTLRVVRVLEFGAGMHSTLTFLNLTAFPDVVSVDSIESDAGWMSKVSNAAQCDSRLHMRFVEEPIEFVLPEIELESYDLILVDSSTEATRRASLIRELAARKELKPLVAVHDYEVELYRAAAKGFRNRVEFNAYNPSTGILWQTEKFAAKRLKSVGKIIAHHCKRLQPDDLQSWSTTFRKDHTPVAALN